MGFDGILLNKIVVMVKYEICRNFDPRECMDANPLSVDDVGMCILNSLLPIDVPLTWRFSLHQWPFQLVFHEGISMWNHDRRHKQPQYVLLATMCPNKGLSIYDFGCISCGEKQRQ